ncbi:MAG: type II secretion system F family protein [Sulfurospirillum sp.]|nr:MAG: type II secretion system F family protein [Sulfurospirillum sp.]
MKYFEIEYALSGERGRLRVESESKLEAIQEFQAKSIGALISIDEINEPFSKKFEKVKSALEAASLKKKLPLEPYIATLRQLAVMLDAGIPINTCFDEIVSMTEHKQTKAIFSQIATMVESGSSISDAFNAFSFELGNVSPAIISLGEQTGTLSEAVEKLASILNEIHENRQKLKKAMRYPIIVITVMIIAFVTVIQMVVPQFKQMFSELKTELPLPTQLLLATNEFFKSYGLIIIGTIITMIILHKLLYNKSSGYRYFVDKHILKLYLFGKITKLSMVGRFIFVFDRLTNSGVPIIEALKIAKNIIENKYLKDKFGAAEIAIEEGRNLTQGLEECGEFDNITIQMIKAGESSGSLNRMLEKVNIYYTKKYNDIVDNISTYIEPIMIALIAVFLTILALGIFLPMWSMADALDNA